MATLLELKGLFKDSDLHDKVQSALIIAAQNVLDGTPTAAEQTYAAHIFNNPASESKKALMSVLAANSSATVSQIQNATDAAIQTNVTAVLPVLTTAHTGV